MPGIKRHWNEAIDLPALERMPPPGKMGVFLKWGLPGSILALFIAGFFYGGQDAGTDMVVLWSVCTGALAGLGAALALGHPATVLSSASVAPFTTLHPMIAAGWISGMVEAFSRKPKVKDLERLPEDILSFRGFWRNKVTRILLVVAFTNLGASVGTSDVFLQRARTQPRGERCFGFHSFLHGVIEEVGHNSNYSTIGLAGTRT